jgi:hypothetical protein
LARAYAELAILYAKRGDVEGYRSARRSANSHISQGIAKSQLKCVLATADAFAGEFALAQDNIVDGDVPWFDGRGRPRAQIAIGMAKSGALEDAKKAVEYVADVYPFYRCRAFNAYAQARFKQDNTSPNSLLEWVDSMETPIDRIATLCGLAVAAENVLTN